MYKETSDYDRMVIEVREWAIQRVLMRIDPYLNPEHIDLVSKPETLIAYATKLADYVLDGVES